MSRTRSSEMLCGAVRLLEPQHTTHDFRALRAEALTPQQAINPAAMKTETKCSSTKMVPMHKTALSHLTKSSFWYQLYGHKQQFYYHSYISLHQHVNCMSIIVTNSMEHTWEADSSSAHQEIPHILWNRSSSTVFTRAGHLSLVWITSLQSTYISLH